MKPYRDLVRNAMQQRYHPTLSKCYVNVPIRIPFVFTQLAVQITSDGIPVRQDRDGACGGDLLIPHGMHLRAPGIAADPQEVAGSVSSDRRL